ncbi:hypothetical protein GL297_08895 [Komagataeibacter sp. FXV2]|nr:hypothetical protein [Komagataeibacter sp. FXV2]
MANELNISSEVHRRLNDILAADGADFVQLVAIAGLDPSEDFLGADLQGVDFGICDLTGYDFSGADLRQARLDRAKLDGAIFTGARSEGAIWPRTSSRNEKFEPTLRYIEKYKLHDFQQAIVNAAVGAFDRGTLRPIVAMPLGTGRSIVLRALLAALDERGDLRQALILAETRVEMEQLHQSLASAFGTDAVAPISPASSSLRPRFFQRLIVESVTSLGPDRSSKGHPVPATKGDISHIVILGDSDLRRRVQMLEQQYPGVPILTFVSRTGGQISDRFMKEGTLIFILSYKDAVGAEVLRPATLVRRIDVGGHGEDERLDYRRICSNIADTIETMPRNLSGAVVCRDIHQVQTIASQLKVDLLNADRDQSFRRIVQHTSASADYSLVAAALEMPGTILVMTKQTYNRFDWGTVDFIFVVTRLKHPELAAFPRFSPSHALTVFDYVGSFKSFDL